MIIKAGCRERENFESVIACIESSDIESVRLKDQIIFTNCSQNATSFFWDFGDGNTSSEENPTHQFQSTGEFEIKMTASNEISSDSTSTSILVYDISNGNNQYKISEGLYPYLFETASYWIYGTDDNLQIDSIKLKQIDLDTIYMMPGEPGMGPQGEIHYYELTYESSISGEYQEYFNDKYISKYYSEESGFVPNVFIATQEIGDYSRNVKLKNIHSSMVVNHITYYNVREMEISKEIYNHKQDSIPDMSYYFVDSIGIIKK